MTQILVAYSTVDGHTLMICRRIRDLLESDGHSVTLSEIGKEATADAATYDKLVVGASIRYGRHREEVYEFVEAHRRSLEQRPNAFFSVNVVARKPGKDTPEGNPYVQRFCRRTRWIPNELGVFAGKIEYSKYGLLDRYLIRFIMWLTKGPTDLHSSVEFTNWSQVDAFARRVSLM
jgi:menaquinone-dependent protoporphyrinogen oxidase